MKKKIIAVIAVVAVIAALGIGLFAYLNYELSFAKPPLAIVKNITLIISADGTSETYDVTTEAETLGKMLVEEGYVKNNQSSYGLYIQTVYGPFKDGRTADDSKEEWWGIMQNGIAVMTGADQITLVEGDKYELVLRTGYDNF